jgi:FSR family fosmidomycin resistance protein-like MFS transporter
VLGVGLYLPFSVQTTLGQELLPNRVGTASGVTLGLAVSAGGAVTPLFGVLADAHGLGWSVAALLPLPLLALLVSLRLPGPTTSARGASRAEGAPAERTAPHR